MNIYLTRRFRESIFFEKFRDGYYPTIVNNMFFNHRHIPDYNILHDLVRIISDEDYTGEGIKIDYINDYQDFSKLNASHLIIQVIIVKEETFDLLNSINSNLEQFLNKKWLILNINSDNINEILTLIKLLQLKQQSKIVFVSGDIKDVPLVVYNSLIPPRLLKAMLIFADEDLKVKILKLIKIIIYRDKGRNSKSEKKNIFELTNVQLEFINTLNLSMRRHYVYDYFINNTSNYVF